MYSFQWTIFFNFDLKRIIENYFDIAKPPNFMCFQYIWMSQIVNFFHFLKNSKFGDTNTMCCIKIFVKTLDVMAKIQSKYNVIISDFKTFTKFKG